MSAQRLAAAMAAVMAAVMVTALAGFAIAAPAQAKTVGKEPGPPFTLATDAPSGYVIVRKGPITVKPTYLPDLEVFCPTGKVPLGGGVYTPSTSVLVNAAMLDPSWASMDAWILNGSSQTTTAYVYVICATKPTNYSFSSSDELDVRPHSQLNNATTTCPKGKPLSGGMFFNSTSGDVQTTINTSLPQGNGWRADANNNGTQLDSIQMSVVCGTLSGYHVVTGPSVLNPAGEQSDARAQCDTGVPVGGGSYSSSTSPKVAINSSLPQDGGWTTYMNNGSTSDAHVITYVICAS